MNPSAPAFALRGVIVVAWLVLSVVAHAQQPADKWPSRPVQLLAGFPVGGLVDTANRLLQDKLQQSLGATIVPMPIAGAGGSIATQKLMAAPPDGYTLMMQTTGTLFTRPLLNAVGYSYKDFTPIATVNTSVTTIAVKKDSPWTSMADLIRDAKANPKKYNYGTSGLGGLQHLAMDILAQKAGFDIVHVPYQGGPQAIQALLGDQVNIVVGDNLHSELRYLATTHSDRSPLLPQVPTLKELGFDVELVVRMMLIGPKGLPADIVSRVEAAARSAVSDPDTRAKFESRGLEARFEDSKQLAQIWEREAQTFKERIEALGFAHYQQKKP